MAVQNFKELLKSIFFWKVILGFALTQPETEVLRSSTVLKET